MALVKSNLLEIKTAWETPDGEKRQEAKERQGETEEKRKRQNEGS